MEIEMTGLWKGAGLLLKNLISDYLEIQNSPCGLPEAWLESVTLTGSDTVLSLCVQELDDGSLSIRSHDGAVAKVLAPP